MHPALSRIFGALWPLLFVPLVIALIKSGKVGPYEHLAFEIGEPLGIATLIYATIYGGFWICGANHAISAVTSALMTIAGLMFYGMIVPPP